MNKEWHIYEADEKEVSRIEEKYNLNNLLARILVNRNITQDDKIRLFLEPTRNDFYNPYLIKDMENAVERII